MSKRRTLDRADLLQLAGDVRYELDVLLQAARAGFDRVVKGRDAMRLESGLIHLRNLDDFFGWPGHRVDDDLTADDYLPSWERRSILDDSDRRAVNKYLAHLTTVRKRPWRWNSRLWVPDVVNVWNQFHHELYVADGKMADRFGAAETPPPVDLGFGTTTTNENVISIGRWSTHRGI